MIDRVAGTAASNARPGLGSTDMIRRLHDIEEIRQLKHRYMRWVDLKMWEELVDALTPDATLGTGTSAFGKPVEISGGREIVGFLRARLGAVVLTEHTVGQPEISVDGDTAIGVWSQRELILATRHRMIIASSGFAEETYQRGTEDRWRISRISYARSYEAMMSLDDLPSFRLIAQPDPPAQPSDDDGEAAVLGLTLPGVPLTGSWLVSGNPAKNAGQPTAAAAELGR
jgi:hypothetical protein